MALIPFVRALRLWAERDPRRRAVTDHARTVTREALERRTNRLARAYAARGVTADRFVPRTRLNGLELFVVPNRGGTTWFGRCT